MSHIKTEIVTNWYNRTSKGKKKSNRMFRENDVIFSYGHHFPIAVHFDENTILFNNDEYSRSTSDHQAAVRSVIKFSEKEVVKVNTSFIRSVIDYTEMKMMDGADLSKEAGIPVKLQINQIKHYIKKQKRARVNDYRLPINKLQQNIRKIIQLFDPLLTEMDKFFVDSRVSELLTLTFEELEN